MKINRKTEPSLTGDLEYAQACILMETQGSVMKLGKLPEEMNSKVLSILKKIVERERVHNFQPELSFTVPDHQVVVLYE